MAVIVLLLKEYQNDSLNDHSSLAVKSNILFPISPKSCGLLSIKLFVVHKHQDCHYAITEVF